MADTHTTAYPPQDRMRQARTFPGLTPTERCLLFIVADYANSRTAKCWPGTKTLAADIGLTRPNVSKCVKRLEQKGALICVRTLGTHNVYVMNMEQKGCAASDTPVDKWCAASDTGGVPLAIQGCAASDTGGVPLAIHEQSINREEKRERTESPDFSSSLSSSDGDKGGEAVQDERAPLTELLHNLAARMPQSKPGAIRHYRAEAAPTSHTKAPSVEPPVSPCARRTRELMAAGLAFVEANAQAERECGLDSPPSPASPPEAPTATEQAAAAAAVQDSLPPTLPTTEEFPVTHTPAADGA